MYFSRGADLTAGVFLLNWKPTDEQQQYSRITGRVRFSRWCFIICIKTSPDWRASIRLTPYGGVRRCTPCGTPVVLPNCGPHPPPYWLPLPRCVCGPAELCALSPCYMQSSQDVSIDHLAAGRPLTGPPPPAQASSAANSDSRHQYHISISYFFACLVTQ